MSGEFPIVEIIEGDEADSSAAELAAIEAREAESREKCFEKIVELCPGLNEVERQAILRDMASGKTRMWSGYNGDDVRLKKVTAANGMVRISFEMDQPMVDFDEIVIV